MDALIGFNGTIMKPLIALKDALKKKMNVTTMKSYQYCFLKATVHVRQSNGFFLAVIKVTKLYFSHGDYRGLPEIFSLKRVIYFFSCRSNLVHVHLY